MAITKCRIWVAAPPVCDQRYRLARECNPISPRRLKDRFITRRTSMAKSSVSDMTTRRPKEPFDPALEAPIALTPDQIEKVVGGLVSSGLLRSVLVGGGATSASSRRLSACRRSSRFDAARRYAQKKAPAWLRKWIGGLDVEPSFPTPRLSECSSGRQRCTSLRRAHRYSRRTPRGLSDRDAARL